MPLTDGPVPYMDVVAQIESGGNHLARSSTSSAQGLFQFTLGTWEQLRRDNPSAGLTSNGRLDAAQSRRAFALFTNNNAKILADALGQRPDDAALYLAHWLGAYGAISVARCPKTAPISSVIDRRAVAGNPNLRGKTCGQVIAYVRSKFRNDIPTFALAPSTQAAARRVGTRDLNTAELLRVRALADEVLVAESKTPVGIQSATGVALVTGGALAQKVAEGNGMTLFEPAVKVQ